MLDMVGYMTSLTMSKYMRALFGPEQEVYTVVRYALLSMLVVAMAWFITVRGRDGNLLMLLHINDVKVL